MGNKPGKAKNIKQVKGQQPLFGASKGSVPTTNHYVYVEKKVSLLGEERAGGDADFDFVCKCYPPDTPIARDWYPSAVSLVSQGTIGLKAIPT